LILSREEHGVKYYCFEQNIILGFQGKNEKFIEKMGKKTLGMGKEKGRQCKGEGKQGRCVHAIKERVGTSAERGNQRMCR
jgi:hypothetical protein